MMKRVFFIPWMFSCSLFSSQMVAQTQLIPANPSPSTKSQHIPVPAPSIMDWGKKAEDFSISQRFLAWTTTFDIKTKGLGIGCVRRTLFSLLPEYVLVDTSGAVLARAKMRFWSWGATFDIYNDNGEQLVSLSEKFTWFFPTFTIASPTGKILAKATLNFWGTTYTISDPADSHTIATLSRPFFRFSETWAVHIEDPGAIATNRIHPHAFLTLMAFQVDREFWQRCEREREERKRFAEKGVSIDRAQKALIRKWRKQLQPFRKELKQINPNQEDLLMVESLAGKIRFTGSAEDKTAQFAFYTSQLLEYLKSDQLTREQKAALCLMLAHVLRQR